MGFFIGEVKTEWLTTNRREMRLLEDFKFIDKAGIEWIAPAGSIIDGASIPRFFWRIIGSPFIGNYRRASVIHDVYCKTQEKPSPEVHAMFWEAMLTDMTPRRKAIEMWIAVRLFGPRFQGCQS
jgi:hypothetical protein